METKQIADNEIAKLVYDMLATGRTPHPWTRSELIAEFEKRFPKGCDRPLKKKAGKG